MIIVNFHTNFQFTEVLQQSCPLTPILLDIFINDILNNCDKYGANISGKRCSGDLFADNGVLPAPSKPCIRILSNKIHECVIQNEITFGINKCATMIVKPLYYNTPPNLVNPIFYLGFHPLLKTN